MYTNVKFIKYIDQISAPDGITPSTVSSESIRVSVIHPNETNGINFYNLLAFWNETVMGECNITHDSAEQGCLIERLEPSKNYTIVAHSCIADNSTILRSVEATTTFYLEGKLRFSFST